MYLIGFYSKKNISKLNKFDYYKKSFGDLLKSGINVIYFYEEDNSFILEKEIIEGIKKIGINIISFKNENEIIKYLKKLHGKIFINTFEEQEILFTNRIRKSIGQKTTKNPEIFLNKFLQRKTIGDIYPETIVKYKLLSPKGFQKINTKELPQVPFIIKPTGGVQSSGVNKVEKIENLNKALNTTLESFKKLEDKRLTNQKIIIEELIDGEMYTIDYYVDEQQTITMTKPVLVKIGFDYGIKDFCNIARFISKEIEEKVPKKELEEFIKKTIIGGNIKNTFIHHEFKINSKGEFKTIETNGRIGGYRLDMYQVGYNINILRFPFEKKETNPLLQKNIAMFALYPRQKCIFYGYNEDIIKKIESLKSFHRINKLKTQIGTEIGLTQDGYSKVGSIELANNNYKEFEKDVEILENIYFDIIKIKK